ncbi:periplasmic heavy metal sensor [Ramlibacter henchirensis]|uniref:Periplasmic heavy metal sensor n=1 Tax=Ramlibacter henchirensis TaxID=204072 RepID=A0A4Z0C6C3_9BURK|nr:periplasmic heavy metal sensor [Ramlibacter henchirensis]TFZ06020.1 periplasmic heavy metal sensor [Ramlibacter henchirensis]
MKIASTLALASLVASASLAQVGPYAGQQDRAIKALSERDIAELRQGQGMGLAKAAELNGYPGPAHVLEHAAALSLTPAQRSASEALMHGHKARARELGESVIEAERALDNAFASRRVDSALLQRLTSEIGLRQARLREEHLRAHLEQAALLEPQQVERYRQLRGYASPEQTSPKSSGPHRGHH